MIFKYNNEDHCIGKWVAHRWRCRIEDPYLNLHIYSKQRCRDNSTDKDSLFNNDARITGNIYAK